MSVITHTKVAVYAAILSVAFSHQVFSADPLDTWHNRSYLGSTNLSDVTYGNNTFVATGSTYDGVILSSKDGGISWTKTYSDSHSSIRGLSYSPDHNLFIALDFPNYIIRSQDGMSWISTQLSGFSSYPDTIAYLNRTFIATYDGGIILASSDGNTWLPRYAGTGDILDGFYGIAYGNNKFVAVGYADYLGLIGTSPDAATWTIGKINNDSSLAGEVRFLNDVVYANNKFVAVGGLSDMEAYIVSSPDGINWTKVYYEDVYGKSPGLNGISYAEGVFVAVGNNGRILTSTDAMTWTERPSNVNIALYDVTYGNNSFVIVGEKSTILQSAPPYHDSVSKCAKAQCGSNTKQRGFILEFS